MREIYLKFKQVGILSICLVLISSTFVSAQSQSLRSKVENGMPFFENGGCSTDIAPSVEQDAPEETGGVKNEDYAGNPVWTKDELAKIDKHRPTYVEAAKKEDVPWAMLAVIHKRESSLGLTYNSNGQGIYQFYEDAGKYPSSGTATPAEFKQQTEKLAKQLQDDYVKRNHSANRGPLKASGTAANVIQDTFFSYNGRSSGYAAQAKSLGFTKPGEGFQGSPYVMNKADAKRDPNKNKTTWGQVKTDGGPIEYPANQDYGAWVYYAALVGIGGDVCSGITGGPTKQLEINGIVYAWPIAPGQKKADHKGLLSPLPCNSPQGCHYGAGTDPAFDITRRPGGNAAVGTEVFAITDGTLANVRPVYNGQVGCQSLQLVSKDGYKYWYGHIKKVPVGNNAKVKVGDPLGVLGESRCSCPNCSAPPHLHIDRGAPKGNWGGGMGPGARDTGFVKIINQLFGILD